MKLVVLAGIPGSGTTTVLNGALEQLDYTHINYGDVMLQIAQEKGLAKERDEIRKLSPEDQKVIQQLAAKTIKSRSLNEDVIVDTHCTISTPSGFLPGLPKWVLDELQPTMFLLIENDAGEIYGRRNSDESRNRDVESLEDIELHQTMNRSAAISYAILTGATVKMIQNPDNKLDETVQNMVNILKI